MQTVTVTIFEGPTISVPWFMGMNAQQALEIAYDINEESSAPVFFTFALEYFGKDFGYLVIMINDTWETTNPQASPYYYWDFLVNDVSAEEGIDNTILNAGDVITFKYESYPPRGERSAARKMHGIRQARLQRRGA